MELACVDFINYRIDIEVSFMGRVQSGGGKFLNRYLYTVLFFFLPDFVPLSFTGKVLMRQF